MSWSNGSAPSKQSCDSARTTGGANDAERQPLPSRLYEKLEPEERFRLVVAAFDRGDGAERQRLDQSAGPLWRGVRDYAPYLDALCDLAGDQLLDLLDQVSAYLEVLIFVAQGDLDLRELCQALGFRLRVSWHGWVLFCMRLGVPPFTLWRGCPGFDRLQRALEVSSTFTTGELLRWLNRRRPEGAPQLTELPDHLTTEGVAEALEGMYREHVARYGGGWPNPMSGHANGACESVIVDNPLSSPDVAIGSTQ